MSSSHTFFKGSFLRNRQQQPYTSKFIIHVLLNMYASFKAGDNSVGNYFFDEYMTIFDKDLACHAFDSTDSFDFAVSQLLLRYVWSLDSGNSQQINANIYHLTQQLRKARATLIHDNLLRDFSQYLEPARIKSLVNASGSLEDVLFLLPLQFKGEHVFSCEDAFLETFFYGVEGFNMVAVQMNVMLLERRLYIARLATMKNSADLRTVLEGLSRHLCHSYLYLSEVTDVDRVFFSSPQTLLLDSQLQTFYEKSPYEHNMHQRKTKYVFWLTHVHSIKKALDLYLPNIVEDEMQRQRIISSSISPLDRTTLDLEAMLNDGTIENPELMKDYVKEYLEQLNNG